ncbi:MAG: phosphorylase [Ruminococcaceae bacterium]|nr:phosphorylase [Oscillospiraceae bacterium]
MITDAFHRDWEPVVTPEMIYGAKKDLSDVCIVTFSKVIFENVLQQFSCEKVAEINACNGSAPIYRFLCQGRRITCYLSDIGAACAGTDLIEAAWLTGAEKFVMFGSAGCLNRERAEGKYVVPTRAYRDEGLSYHFAPPADYIDIPGAARVAAEFDALGVPYVTGGAWTTDALYRETRQRMEARRAEGCLAVDMELAGIQAVCSFYGWALYDFLVPGDVLDAPVWSYATLREANHSLGNFDLALELAVRI